MEPLLRGKAERAGVAQPEEEKAPQRPYCDLPVSKRGLEKRRGDFLVEPVVIGKGVMVLS